MMTVAVLRNISSSLHPRFNNWNVHLPVRQCSASLVKTMPAKRRVQRMRFDKERLPASPSRHRLMAGPMNATIEHAWSLFRSLDGYCFTKIRPPVLSNVEDGVGTQHMASRHFWFLFASKTEDPADLVESWCRLTLLLSKGI